MYIVAFIEFLKSEKCFFCVIVFGCECVYCSMQHRPYCKIFIIMFKHIGRSEVRKNVVDSWEIVTSNWMAAFFCGSL